MYLLYKQYKKIALFFIASCIILYGNSLKNKYALDDDYVTVTNFPVKGQNFVPNQKQTSKGFKGIPEIWRSNYAHDNESSFEYRPLTTTTFAIEYQFFGQNPFISHLINLLLYILTVWCIFCILMELFRNFAYAFTLAFLTTFVFLLHPIHTEVVDNIKCRDELMAFLFPLLALWYSLKCYDKPSAKSIILIILFLLLGLFSKKSALLFMAIIPLALFFYRQITRKAIIIFGSSLLLMRVLYFFIKSKFLTENEIRFFYHFENPLFTENVSFLGKIIAALKTLGFYVKFLVFPYPFRFYYGGNTLDISSSITIYLIIGILFLIGGALYYFKTKSKLFLFSFLLFLGTIFPFVNFASPVAGIVGERLAYQSSLWFCLILISIALPYIPKFNHFNIKNFSSKPLVYSVPLIMICSIYIINRNTQWNTKVTLFEHDMPRLKESAKGNSLMANEYFEMLRVGQNRYTPEALVQKALYHYNLAIKNDSSFYSCYNNAGVIYYTYMGDVNSAKKHFNLAIKYKANYPQAYENLGNCYKYEKNTEEAFKSYKKAWELNPQQYPTYLTCMKMFYEIKEYKKSIAVNKLASYYFPNDYTFIGQEADCLFMLGDIKKALEKYKEAYAISPNPQLAKYLASKYLEAGDSLNYHLFKDR